MGRKCPNMNTLDTERADSLPGLRVPTSIAYAGGNLVGNDQQPKEKRNK
jgi:hypothetical protein